LGGVRENKRKIMRREEETGMKMRKERETKK
jgi:hypothetical protein